MSGWNANAPCPPNISRLETRNLRESVLQAGFGITNPAKARSEVAAVRLGAARTPGSFRLHATSGWKSPELLSCHAPFACYRRGEAGGRGASGLLRSSGFH